MPVYIIAAAAGGGVAALGLAILGVYCYRRRKGRAARGPRTSRPISSDTSASLTSSSPVTAERPLEVPKEGVGPTATNESSGDGATDACVTVRV